MKGWIVHGMNFKDLNFGDGGKVARLGESVEIRLDIVPRFVTENRSFVLNRLGSPLWFLVATNS